MTLHRLARRLIAAWLMTAALFALGIRPAAVVRADTEQGPAVEGRSSRGPAFVTQYALATAGSSDEEIRAGGSVNTAMQAAMLPPATAPIAGPDIALATGPQKEVVSRLAGPWGSAVPPPSHRVRA